jgi:carbon monoxide dehydrogenase subunit G
MLTFLAVLAAMLAGAAAYIATRAPHFRVERQIEIKASPEEVFAIINDLHRWDAWSPWAKRDPAMKTAHSGSTHGIGSVYEWEGNKHVGKGRMEIVGAEPSSRTVIKLDFIAPFEAHNTVEFLTVARGGNTLVTWVIHGPMNFMSKAMGVFMSMDKMMGPDFEQGLASLKAIAEA